MEGEARGIRPQPWRPHSRKTSVLASSSPVQSPLWPETLAEPQALVWCLACPGPALAQPQLGPGEDSLLPGETVGSGRVGDTWPSQGSLLTPLPLTSPQTRSSRLCHFICHLPLATSSRREPPGLPGRTEERMGWPEEQQAGERKRSCGLLGRGGSRGSSRGSAWEPGQQET